MKFKVEESNSHLVNSVSLPGNINALSISQIKKEVSSSGGTSPRSFKPADKQKPKAPSSDSHQRRRKKKSKLLSNTDKCADRPPTPYKLKKPDEIQQEHIKRDQVDTNEKVLKRSSSMGEASPLTRVMSGDGVSLMSNLFIDDVMKSDIDQQLLPTLADISGTTIDGIHLKNEVESATMIDLAVSKTRSLDAVPRGYRKPKDSKYVDKAHDKNLSNSTPLLEKRPKKKRKSVSSVDKKKSKPRNRTRSQNSQREYLDPEPLSIPVKHVENTNQEKESEEPEQLEQLAPSRSISLPSAPEQESQPSTKGRVPRLVERWQETITSLSSQDLTGQQLAKQKKFQELSLSMGNVKQRFLKDEVKLAKKGSLPGVFGDDEVLASSRRLQEFMIGTPKTDQRSLISGI